MTPHLTDELAQRLVDGGLESGERDAAERHAACCAGCAALVDSYRFLGEALEGLDCPPPPPDFTQGVMARIDEREQARTWERRLALGILGVTAALATAAVASAGAGGWAPLLSSVSAHLRGLLGTLALVGSVLGPVVRALRLPIALGCTALALPLLFALSRLVPRPARAEA